MLRDQPFVAGRHREAVIFADGWMGDNFDAQIEIPDHAADDGELLKILFPEDRGIAAAQVEKLEDNRADAVEVARAGGTAEIAGKG